MIPGHGDVGGCVAAAAIDDAVGHNGSCSSYVGGGKAAQGDIVGAAGAEEGHHADC